MHGGDSLSKLSPDRALIAPPPRLVPLQATPQAETRGTMNKNAQVEETAQTPAPQQPQTVHQDERFWSQQSNPPQSRVSPKTVARQQKGATLPASEQHGLGQRPINGPRMVKIHLVAQGSRKMRLVAIKIIQRHPR